MFGLIESFQAMSMNDWVQGFLVLMILKSINDEVK